MAMPFLRPLPNQPEPALTDSLAQVEERWLALARAASPAETEWEDWGSLQESALVRLSGSFRAARSVHKRRHRAPFCQDLTCRA